MVEGGFLAVHPADYKILTSEIVDFSSLNRNQNSTSESFYFEEYEERNRQKLSEISKKYEPSKASLPEESK